MLACLSTTHILPHTHRWGPSFLTASGSLMGWTRVPQLHRITAPTLVYNGEFDTSHDVATVPFFDHIPRVRWKTIAGVGTCVISKSMGGKKLSYSWWETFCDKLARLRPAMGAAAAAQWKLANPPPPISLGGLVGQGQLITRCLPYCTCLSQEECSRAAPIALT